MKTKKIRIKDMDQFFGDILEVADKIDSEQKPKKLRGEYFESLEAVRNILTPKRLVLWRLIRDQSPNSILALAKLARRDFKSVYRDLMMLVNVGLVELKKSRGAKGSTQKPVSLADAIQLEVA